MLFTDMVDESDHLQVKALFADVLLDTQVMNGHTTSADLLYAGVPVVTLPGDRMTNRVASSLASASGTGAATTVRSFKEYEDLLVEMQQAQFQMRARGEVRQGSSGDSSSSSSRGSGGVVGGASSPWDAVRQRLHRSSRVPKVSPPTVPPLFNVEEWAEDFESRLASVWELHSTGSQTMHIS